MIVKNRMFLLTSLCTELPIFCVYILNTNLDVWIFASEPSINDSKEPRHDLSTKLSNLIYHS